MSQCPEKGLINTRGVTVCGIPACVGGYPLPYVTLDLPDWVMMKVTFHRWVKINLFSDKTETNQVLSFSEPQ